MKRMPEIMKMTQGMKEIVFLARSKLMITSWYIQDTDIQITARRVGRSMVPAMYSFMVRPLEICASHLETVGVQERNQKIQLAAVAPQKYSRQKLPVILPVMGLKAKSVSGVESTARKATKNTRKASFDMPLSRLLRAEIMATATVMAASMNLRPGKLRPMKRATVFMPVQREMDMPSTVESMAASLPILLSMCFMYHRPMTEYRAQTGAPLSSDTITMDSTGFRPSLT